MASTSHQTVRSDPGTAATVAAVIETPRGSRNKYKLDEATGRMKLSKIMPEGMVFPFDFGFFPGTKGPDGDPLDVLILHDEPTFPGCQIDCQLLGILKARDFQEGREAANDRIIAAATASLEFAGVRELSELEPGFLKQVEEFFVNYKKARGVRFEITGRGGSRAAYELLASSQDS